MAIEAVENEVDEIQGEAQTEELQTDQLEGEEGEQETKAEAEPEEVVVTIGDESPPSEEVEVDGLTEVQTRTFRELRQVQKQTSRENRELRAQLAAAKTQAQEPEKVLQLGPKPTLEGAEYDTEKFESDLTAWHERKREADAQDRKKQEDATAAQAAWNAKLESHQKLKAALKVSDFEDAESVVDEFLSIPQKGMIIDGMDNSAVVLYALGKNPVKLKELASITSPVKFVAAVAKLEEKMKVTPRKTAPLPESRVSGSGRTAAGTDTKLAALEKEAERTNDRTKVVAYKRELRNSKG